MTLGQEMKRLCPGL